MFLTSAPSGSDLYACTASNVWTLEGSGTLTVKVSGTVAGAEPVLDILPGTGIVAALADTGTEVDATLAVDSAIVLTKSTAQSGSSLLCSSATGSASTYGCSMTPTLTAASLIRGALFEWIPDVTCASGGITLNIDSLGARSIFEADEATSPGPSNCPSGGLKLIWYDGAAFRFLF